MVELEQERARHAGRDEVNAAWERFRDRVVEERRKLRVDLSHALGIAADERGLYPPIPVLVEVAEVARAERDELRAHGVARDIGEANDELRAELAELNARGIALPEVGAERIVETVMAAINTGTSVREEITGLLSVWTAPFRPDTEATEEAGRRSDVAVLPNGWEDIVEMHSAYVDGRCGCGELCPDRDALARHREAVLAPAAPTEPRMVEKRKNCFHPWPGCNCEVEWVVEDQAGGGQP